MENINKAFIIIPPGLEEIATEELKTKFQFHFPDHKLEYLQTDGGIEVSCELEIIFLLNMILRIPSKIILRIEDFKCRDAPKLFNKISKIKWSDYLISDEITVEATSHNSRLFDSRKIESAVTDAIKKYIHANPVKKKYLELFEKEKFKNEILIRIIDDHCQVSLCTSGSLLYFRGGKTLTGHAPIRENLASALIKLTLNQISKNELTIIDPMCGSGTFIKEALELNQLNQKRFFSFQHFPSYLRINNKIKLKEDMPNLFEKGYAGDIDQNILKMTRDNLKTYPNVAFHLSDLLESKIKLNFEENPNRVVLINPPYGIRVKTDQEIDSKYYEEILNSVALYFKPLRLGMIVPSEYTLNFESYFKLISKTKLKNGGIPIIFYVLESK